jgi:hypothetical protein
MDEGESEWDCIVYPENIISLEEWRLLGCYAVWLL